MDMKNIKERFNENDECTLLAVGSVIELSRESVNTITCKHKCVTNIFHRDCSSTSGTVDRRGTENSKTTYKLLYSRHLTTRSTTCVSRLKKFAR